MELKTKKKKFNNVWKKKNNSLNMKTINAEIPNELTKISWVFLDYGGMLVKFILCQYF